MARRKRLMLAALVVLLLVAPAVLGWPNFAGPTRPVVAASAPREASGLTVFFAAPQKLIGPSATQAWFQIVYGGVPVYPSKGGPAALPVLDRQGTIYVPYSDFVVGNGPYEVRLTYEGETGTARVKVDKWVEWVYLHPYHTDRGEVAVDVQLSRQMGGAPQDRITTYGDLTLHVYYRGQETSGATREYVGRMAVKTASDRDFTRLEVPKSTFSRGAGYYSFESKFDNLEAKGNYGVVNDPRLADRSPPWNWIRIH